MENKEILNNDIDRTIDEAFERLKNAPSLIIKKNGHLMLNGNRRGKSMVEEYLEDKYGFID